MNSTAVVCPQLSFAHLFYNHSFLSSTFSALEKAGGLFYDHSHARPFATSEDQTFELKQLTLQTLWPLPLHSREDVIFNT